MKTPVGELVGKTVLIDGKVFAVDKIVAEETECGCVSVTVKPEYQFRFSEDAGWLKALDATHRLCPHKSALKPTKAHAPQAREAKRKGKR